MQPFTPRLPDQNCLNRHSAIFARRTWGRKASFKTSCPTAKASRVTLGARTVLKGCVASSNQPGRQRQVMQLSLVNAKQGPCQKRQATEVTTIVTQTGKLIHQPRLPVAASPSHLSTQPPLVLGWLEHYVEAEAAKEGLARLTWRVSQPCGMGTTQMGQRLQIQHKEGVFVCAFSCTPIAYRVGDASVQSHHTSTTLASFPLTN